MQWTTKRAVVVEVMLEEDDDNDNNNDDDDDYGVLCSHRDCHEIFLSKNGPNLLWELIYSGRSWQMCVGMISFQIKYSVNAMVQQRKVHC
jgi:hypothetical protein